MFRIRKEQMDFFADKTRRRFVTMMTDYLRSDFGSWVQGMSDADLGAWVAAAVAKTQRYGVNTEPEAAQLVLLFLVLGLDADDGLPWVKETLDSRDLYAIGKVRKLVRLARQHGVDGVDDVVVYEQVEA